MSENLGAGGVPPIIVRLVEVPGSADLSAALDEIFFSSSATKSFASDADRRAFRERWLGRYVRDDPDWFYVVLSGGRIVGYLAGAIDDPAATGRFSDIGYFFDIAEETARYPAHLHVNIAKGYRSGGLGSRLIERFVSDLRQAGVRGVHLVTGRDSRNVPFYLKNGFEPVKIVAFGESESVMLGRRLD